MNLSRLSVLAQQGGADEVSNEVGAVVVVIYLAVIIVSLAGMWKVFAKAGKPGWGAIVPIYNTILLLEIVGKPIWWFLLLFIPCVGIVVAVILFIELAKCFGKGAGFGLGLALLSPIFFPLLGFGDAKYRGPQKS